VGKQATDSCSQLNHILQDTILKHALKNESSLLAFTEECTGLVNNNNMILNEYKVSYKYD
jgi:hypothetical protein